MRRLPGASLSLCVPLLVLLTGCGTAATPPAAHPRAAETPAPLGRVVVYRSGVAYFERTAKVPGDTLTLPVASDKVADLLKSLDVSDARTGAPAGVEFATDPKPGPDGIVELRVQLPGQHPHEVKLSYLTASRAWTPSYRVIVGDQQKVDLAAWAVVENTSGEDWKDVRLGVGASPPAVGAGGAQPAGGAEQDPVGTSHFESPSTTTVPHGTSAMVSVLHTPAEGEIVYVYDPKGAPGAAQVALKSLRLRNPTDSQLEAGPVTVFGDGGFVGEGAAEPIPPRGLAFVPFALDRQVVVEPAQADHDEVVGISTAQRGVFSVRAQHVRRTTLVVHNRLPSRAVVYLRHEVPAGYHASKTPTDPEHAGRADLYRVEVDGLGKQEVVLEETAPSSLAIDVRTPGGIAQLRAFLAQGSRDEKLRAQVERLAALEKAIDDGDRRLAVLRARVAEEHQRTEQLKAQITQLRGARGAAPLTASLQAKLKEITERSTRDSAEVAELEEHQVLARIELQDRAADVAVDGPSSAVTLNGP